MTEKKCVLLLGHGPELQVTRGRGGWWSSVAVDDATGGASWGNADVVVQVCGSPGRRGFCSHR